jgi:uncharacterized membrane protein (DUF106 family)
MSILNAVLGTVFDLIVGPFRTLNPWIAMAVVSVLTGLLMLAVFRWTSNQEGIRRSKNAIKAHLLELRLYNASLAQQLRSQGRILRANGRYFGHALRPMLVMMVPVLLILVQLNLRFGSRPLAPGETAILKVKLTAGHNPVESGIVLEAPPGVAVESPPLRIEEDREIDWRLRAVAPGTHQLTLRLGADVFTKTVVVGGRELGRIPNLKPGGSFLDQVFNPGERPIPAGAAVASAEVNHPERRLNLLGLRIHWLVAYFILSLAFGFAFKGVFKVEI